MGAAERLCAGRGTAVFRGNRNGSNISIEIKRASFVVISDGGGGAPSVVSKRFEDVAYDHTNDVIDHRH